ncbi:MAG TPA: AMP-binding protein [Allosphingosinicella sp.]|nr:AMP-binding protein [Allosphingosinicella sp.]
MTEWTRMSYAAADRSVPILSMTAGDALRRAADVAGDRTALVELMPEGFASLTGAAATDRRWTYAALLADAESCARFLLSRFAPGDRICLWAPNVPEWVVLQYGAALAGIVLVTANPALREGELRHVLRQSQACALIHADHFRGSDMAAIALAVADEVRETISLSNWPGLIGEPAAAELPLVAPRSPAQIQFTSGTTGQPKGALLHHEGLVTNAAFVAGRLGQDRDVVVMPMPLFHTAGSVLGVLGCVTTLSTLVLPVLFDPALILAAIERERAAIVSGVPTMFVAMLEQQQKDRRDVSSLRATMSGGSIVAPELRRRIEDAFGCSPITVYGQTELSPIVCQTAHDDPPVEKAETVGRPLPQVEVRIADPETNETLPVNVEGEIQARGYQAMLGYFGQPEATAKTLQADGWLRTGDLGIMDEGLYVRVTGRLSDMIIRGGENIYPAEIEAELLRHPAVAEVAVFGLPDPHWGEIVAAAVRVPAGSAPPPADELKGHVRAQLAPQKAPSTWFLVDALPLTGSGKVQKFALRDAALAGELFRLEC